MKHGTSRRVVALAAAGTMVATGLMAAPATAGGKHDAEGFVERVRVERVVRHLEAFERIAAQNDGNRAALTPGYEASARYVERTLRSAGYQTTRDWFTFEREIVDAATLTVGADAYEVDQMEFSVSTPEGGVSGALVAPNDPLGCTADTWDGVAATGAIAVVSRGVCPFADKAVAAEAAGAAAVVIYNSQEGMLFGTLGAEGLVTVPVAGTTPEDGAALAALAGQGVTATLDVRFHTEEAESFNVLAETRRGRDDNVVMLGAHLDGVEEGPGINDNATGSAALLETAVQLARG